MNISKVEFYLDLWYKPNLNKLWEHLCSLSKEDFAFVIAWMTVTISDDNKVALSQWLVYLETKSNNSN